MIVQRLEREQWRSSLFPGLEAALPASFQALSLLRRALRLNRPLLSVTAVFREEKRGGGGGRLLGAVAILVAELGPVYTFAQGPADMREVLWRLSPRPTVFPSFQDEHLPVLREFIDFSSVSACKTLILQKLPDLPLVSTEEFAFGPLVREDIPTIIANWPYSHLYPENGVPLVADLIATGPTMCARVGGAPVCWMVTYQDSSIGMLHSLATHRRAGLAQQVVARLSHLLLEEGCTPYCHVINTNRPSLSLFTRLGFVEMGSVSWVRGVANKSKL